MDSLNFKDIFGVTRDDGPDISEFIIRDTVDLNNKWTDWGYSNKALDPIVHVCRKMNFRPLVIEISILSQMQDSHEADSERSFTASFACPADIKPESSEYLLSSAYKSLLEKIDISVISAKNFQEKIYLVIDGCEIIKDKIQSDPPVMDWNNVKETTKSLGFAKRVTFKSNKQNTADDEEIKKIHYTTFSTFILKFFKKTQHLPFHYGYFIAIPLQRPKRFNIGLESAGAIFLTLSDDNKCQNTTVKLRFQKLSAYILNYFQQAFLRETRRTADISIQRAHEAEQLIFAYDEIGHVLKTYLFATGNTAAIEGLSKLSRELLKNDEKQRDYLDQAIRSLQFFDCAKAIGSLMNLRGWINGSMEFMKSHKKILRCFEGEDFDSNNGLLVEDWSRFIAYLCASVSSNEERTYGFEVFSFKNDRITLDYKLPKNNDEDDSGKPEIPKTRPPVFPLKNKGDGSALILAISSAFIEPIWNAEKYSAKDQPIRILIRVTSWGKVEIFIGNQIEKNMENLQDTVGKASGLRIVNNILEMCELGNLAVLRPEDAKKKVPCKIFFRNMLSEKNLETQVWLLVSLDIGSLYERAKSFDGE